MCHSCLGPRGSTPRGYAAAGDGGGGSFYFDTSVPSSATITTASFATPIEITTSGNHNLTTGRRIMIAGVATNLAANGNWVITPHATDAKKFTLNGSTGTGAGTGGSIGDRGTIIPSNN